MDTDTMRMIREELTRIDRKMDQALKQINEHETEIRSVKYAAKAIQWFLTVLATVGGVLGLKVIFDK